MVGSRLGVFGGTFNPIHIGHLVAAVNARQAFELDQVLMVVANDPWQKSDQILVPAEVRYRAVEAAVEGHGGLIASHLELDRGGLTYTVDTLRELKEKDPSTQLFLIVGTDVAANIESWRDPDEIAALAELIV